MNVLTEARFDARRGKISEVRTASTWANDYVKTDKGNYPDDYGSLKQVPFLHNA